MKGVIGMVMFAAATGAVAQDTALAPPPITIVEPATRGAELPPPATIEVAITAVRETLWSGSLRVGGYSGANYSQSLRQAAEPCPGVTAPIDNGDRARDSSRQVSLNISRRSRDSADGFYVNARWARPVDACDGATRSVALDQFVRIVPGQTVKLTGDAGLVIALTRK